LKISIIMSVFNGEKHVNSAIKSILNQTFRDFEFIIIDDGSKDNTLKFIKEYAKIDNRIKIIRNLTNIGLTKSLNKAIKLCKGEFIARQDTDDISLPNRLEKQIKFLQNNPDYALCGCDMFRKQNKQQVMIKVFEIDDIRKSLIVENCIAHPTVIIRKIILQKYGYYDEKFLYSQDYELWCRLIYKYNLKAKNLKDKLIIVNMPYDRFFKMNIFKYITQRFNNIRIKLMYLKYTRYKLKCILSIALKLIEIFTLSHIIGHFSKFLGKIRM